MTDYSVWYASVVLMIAGLAVMAGCATEKVDLNTAYTSPEQVAKGLVVILPGIEGEGAANQDIRRGLYKARVPYALGIYRWGSPMPGIGMIINQTDTARNRREATELAKRIAAYQVKNPGKPIFLIGHSGGGGVAVFTLEALAQTPGAKPIEGAFLLSASISANYDLTEALRMTRRGLVNVANPEDQLLNSGTAIMGNVDGGHGDSAGRTGFHRSYPNLYQKRITAASLGVSGSPHFVATNASVIARRAPAWINSQTWPPPGLGR